MGICRYFGHKFIPHPGTRVWFIDERTGIDPALFLITPVTDPKKGLQWVYVVNPNSPVPTKVDTYDSIYCSRCGKVQ